MNETELVNSFDCQNALGHIEFSDIFRKRIVLDKPVIEGELGQTQPRRMSHCDLHGHEISSGQELHHEVQVIGILERIKQLNDPG